MLGQHAGASVCVPGQREHDVQGRDGPTASAAATTATTADSVVCGGLHVAGVWLRAVRWLLGVPGWHGAQVRLPSQRGHLLRLRLLPAAAAADRLRGWRQLVAEWRVAVLPLPPGTNTGGYMCALP